MGAGRRSARWGRLWVGGVTDDATVYRKHQHINWKHITIFDNVGSVWYYHNTLLKLPSSRLVVGCHLF